MARTFWCPRILPKNERTNSSKSEFVCLFFRRIRGYQKSFRNYLTFNNIIVHFYKYQPAIVWRMGLKPRKAQNQYNSYLKLNSSLFFCQINMSFIARKTKKSKMLHSRNSNLVMDSIPICSVFKLEFLEWAPFLVRIWKSSEIPRPRSAHSKKKS